MGVVYEAIDEQIGRRVAIKRLHGEYSRQSDILQRFFNEARAVNLIAHPGIVQVSELATDAAGLAYLVMEYLAGQTLSQRLASSGGRLSEAAALRIVAQIASALSAAHEHGIVHRDLKPSNIMLITDPAMPDGERVKLLDFGIAKLGVGRASQPSRTRTGIILGTPAYMSPEQCLGVAALDGQADVYSLGILAYEMLAGQPPFSAEHDLLYLQMHLTTLAPLLRGRAPAVSPAVESLVDRMLRKEAAARPTMAAVAAEAKRLQGEPLPAPAPPLAQAVVADGPLPASAPSSSTLQQNNGQLAPAGAQRPRLTTWLLLAVGFLAVAVFTYRLRRPAGPGQVAGLASTSSPEKSPTVDLAVAAPVDASIPTLDAGQVATLRSPKQVHITLTSIPGDAQVLKSDTQEVLGTTPWQLDIEQSSANGQYILRKPGYSDRLVTLSYTQDALINESLQALAADPDKKAPVRPPRGARGGPSLDGKDAGGRARPPAKPTPSRNAYDPTKIAD